MCLWESLGLGLCSHENRLAFEELGKKPGCSRFLSPCLPSSLLHHQPAGVGVKSEQVLAPLLNHCVAWGRSLAIPVPQISHLAVPSSSLMTKVSQSSKPVNPLKETSISIVFQKEKTELCTILQVPQSRTVQPCFVRGWS